MADPPWDIHMSVGAFLNVLFPSLILCKSFLMAL